MKQRIILGWASAAFFCGLSLSCSDDWPNPKDLPVPEKPAPQDPDKGEPSPEETELGQWIQRYVDELDGGEPLLEYRGELALAHRQKLWVQQSYQNEPNRRYGLGSITKSFTAVAITQLAQEGKLSVQDSVRKHLPQLPASYEPVTLELLLTHRGGVIEYLEIPEVQALLLTPQEPEAILKLIAAHDPEQVGELASYSNSGFFLLGMVIEAITGQSYEDYVQAHILDPADMRDSGFDIADRARGLTMATGELTPTPVVHPSVAYAAGGLSSTTQDMIKFSNALASHKLLSQAWTERMLACDVVAGPNLRFGWGIFCSSVEGQEVYGHSGSIPGYSSDWLSTRDGAWTGVSVSNLSDIDAKRVLQPAMSMAIGNEPHAAPTFDQVLIAQMKGSYRLNAQDAADLLEDTNKSLVDSVMQMEWMDSPAYLLKVPAQGVVVPLTRLEQRLFRNDRFDISIVLDLDSPTQTRGFEFSQGDFRLRYEPESLQANDSKGAR